MTITAKRIFHKITRELFSSLVFLCILIATPTIHAQPFNLDSLLIESVGGPEAVRRIRAMKSYNVAGKVNWNGIEGNYSAFYFAPDKFRINAEFDGFSIIQGFDGRIAWQKDIHGRVFEMSGFEKTELMRNIFVMSFGYLPDKNALSKCKYGELIPTDSTNFHEIDCSVEEGDTMSILFREDLALPSIYGAYLDNIMLVSVSAELEKVNGIWFPFYTYTSSPQAPIYTEVIVDTIIIDDKIDPALFDKPVIKINDFHFPNDSSSVTIPFHFENGHVTVDIKVNGIKTGRFILDNGASASFYHAEFVKDMELDSLGQVPAMGIGGFQDLQVVKFDSLTIGTVSLYDQTAGVMPLYELELLNSDSVPFGGLLGYDFFVRFPTKFDFKKKELKIYDPKKFAPPSGGYAVHFDFTMMIPTIEANIAETDGKFLIDLGNSFGLIIHNIFGGQLANMDKIEIENYGNRTLGGVGRGVNGTNVKISEIKIGDRNLSVPEAILVEPSEGLTGSRLIAGNIGTKVLEQYSVLFDYSTQKMIIYGLSNSD